MKRTTVTLCLKAQLFFFSSFDSSRVDRRLSHIYFLALFELDVCLVIKNSWIPVFKKKVAPQPVYAFRCRVMTVVKIVLLRAFSTLPERQV
jgi:hypothetical protein